MIIIEKGKWYYWNFRSAMNVKVMAINANGQRSDFWHVENEDGMILVVQVENLSEGPK